MFLTIKKIIWAIVALSGLFLIAYLYSVFMKPNTHSETASTMGILLVGLILGGVIAFLAVKLLNSNKGEKITESSHTVVESMRRVFKVVCAEGQLHEIYNYENNTKLLKFIPSTKKALIIIQARVMIGFDFEKCVWETDPENKKIKIISFPQPEILSLEPKFNYYYFEETPFNLIGRGDLHRIQEQGRLQIENAAKHSDLLKIAADQMRTLLTEVVKANEWEILGIEKIKALIAEKTSEAQTSLVFRGE